MKNTSPTQHIFAVILSISFLVLCQNVSFGQRVTPQNLSFGDVAVGSSATLTLSITAEGGRRLVVESATVSGTDFKISTPSMPITLKPGESASFVVKFTPTASETFNGSVLIKDKREHRETETSESRSESIPLSGTGEGSETLESITISPTSASISVGGTKQFTATGHYSDGSTQNLTPTATWRSTVTSVAAVTAGLATGATAGSSNIAAQSGGMTSSAALLTVAAAATPPVLQSITLSPPSASISVGGTQQFAATGHYSDGSTQNLTPTATWSSTLTSVAAVTAGLATGAAAGSSNIAAKSGGVTSSAALLTVAAAATPPVLQSITLSPPSASISVGGTQQFAATGHYSDGSTQNLTSTATWSSTLTSVATVSAGLATAAAGGSTNIAAQSGGVTSSAAPLTVAAATTPPVLQSITLSPPSASISVGGTQQFAATGHYSDGSTQTLTSTATWSSTVTSVATVTAGLATGEAAGSSNIAAQSGSVTSSAAAVTVSAVTTGGGNTYYVSPTGNDSNPGTNAAPWLTIQHAASTVAAGSTVYVEPGTYNESINVTVSGTSSAPITFIGQTGAIVSGAGLTPSTSQTQGLWNIGAATPAGVDVSYVTIQGFTIENYTTSNANATPAGIWISGASNGIKILNNTITSITTTSEQNGNAFGIAAYGTETNAINGLVISGNTVYGLKTGNSETVNVDGNVTNFTITNNIIHDNDNIGIDAIGGEGVGPSGLDYARYGEISGNTVYNISAIANAGEGDEYDADGIYCDTCAYVIIERNTVHNCDLNIEVASEHSGKLSQYVTVRDNVVYNANSVGISIGGYASNVGGSNYVAIVNNTLYEDDTQNTGSGELQVQYYATNNVFENNIVYATSQGLFINNYTNSEPDPVTADYNLYYSSVGSTSAQFLWNGTTESNGFPGYQSATGQDSHSEYVNPLFVSATGLDLQVESTSPASGAGSVLGTLACSTTVGETGAYWGCPLVGTEDVAGNPRDPSTSINIGAYQ